MANSKSLAGIIGPTIVVLTISESINYHIWAVNIPPNTYLNGLILFVAGLAIVRAHNIWKGWPVLITLFGWINLLGGLARMFFPEAKQLPKSDMTYIGLAILTCIGIFLTYKGFSREEKKIVAD